MASLVQEIGVLHLSAFINCLQEIFKEGDRIYIQFNWL